MALSFLCWSSCWLWGGKTWQLFVNISPFNLLYLLNKIGQDFRIILHVSIPDNSYQFKVFFLSANCHLCLFGFTKQYLFILGYFFNVLCRKLANKKFTPVETCIRCWLVVGTVFVSLAFTM